MKMFRASIAVLASVGIFFSYSSYAISSELTLSRTTQLTHMVLQDCGSCHGMTLKGGLGPTLLPDAMSKLPLSVIKNTILFGREGTAMPPWQSILTEQEALWISQQLQQGFETHD